MENWRELCSVVHKGSPSFAVMREDGQVIEADSFDELIEAIKNDAKVRRNSKNSIVWITRNGKKIPIRGGKMPNGRTYEPQIGSVLRVQGSKGEVINYVVVSGGTFKRNLDKAKSSVSEKAAWRVDDTHSAEDYKEVKTLTTDKGSTIAVKKNGDIISVCRHSKDVATGSDLLHQAVAMGGTKLDSFSGNYDFYVRNGFEPISWTPFNKEYAPHDWVDGKHIAEPVIFFKYTGKQTNKTLKEFLHSVKASKEYDEALEIRDRGM